MLVTDKVEATLRWAGNSMTTNGVSVSRSIAGDFCWCARELAARIGTVVSAEVDRGRPRAWWSCVRGRSQLGAGGRRCRAARWAVRGAAIGYAPGPGPGPRRSQTRRRAEPGLPPALTAYTLSHHSVSTVRLGLVVDGIWRRRFTHAHRVRSRINAKRANAQCLGGDGRRPSSSMCQTDPAARRSRSIRLGLGAAQRRIARRGATR